MWQKDDKYGLPERFVLKAFIQTKIRERCNALRQRPGNVWLGIISSRCKQGEFSASAETKGWSHKWPSAQGGTMPPGYVDACGLLPWLGALWEPCPAVRNCLHASPAAREGTWTYGRCQRCFFISVFHHQHQGKKIGGFVNKGMPSGISHPKQFMDELACAGYFFSLFHSLPLPWNFDSYRGDPDRAQMSLGLNFELSFKPLLALCTGFDQTCWQAVPENSGLQWVFD